MVCAPVRPVAVQPASAPVDAADDDGAVDGRRWIAGGEIRLVEGTLIACANYPGCASHSDFAGHASYGYCPSKSQFVWGMRPVVICDIKGVPVGYDLVGPKAGAERDLRARARRRPPGHLDRRQGFWGREYDACLQLVGVGLITLNNRGQVDDRARSSPKPHPARANPCSRRSSARRAWKSTSPRPFPASAPESRSGCSHSPSASTSTPCSAAQHAPSPPTTDDEPTSSLSHSQRRPPGCDPSGAIAGHVPSGGGLLWSRAHAGGRRRSGRRSVRVCLWCAQPERTSPSADTTRRSSTSPSGPRRRRAAKRGT
jgi:hypothetical protein